MWKNPPEFLDTIAEGIKTQQVIPWIFFKKSVFHDCLDPFFVPRSLCKKTVLNAGFKDFWNDELNHHAFKAKIPLPQNNTFITLDKY